MVVSFKIYRKIQKLTPITCSQHRKGRASCQECLDHVRKKEPFNYLFSTIILASTL